jgi:ribonuclease P protein component
MASTFGPNARLRRREEFVRVERQGRRVSARFLTLVGLPNALERDRLGVIASRRVGGAVARNRAKRRLRALFRAENPAGAPASSRAPMDVVAIARRELVDAPAAALAADFQSALRRLRKTS